MMSEKLKNKNLDQNFRVKGVWWVPSTEDKQEIAGELVYEDGRITLELFGSFEEDIFLEHKHYEVIFGFTSNGDKITLLNVIRTQSKMSFPGFPIRVYTAHMMLAGIHLSSIHSPEIHSAAFNITYLSEWLSITTFKTSKTMNKDNTLQEIHVRYRFPEVFSFTCNINGQQTTVQSTYFINTSRDGIDRLNMSHSSYLKITPESNQSIDWFRRTIFEIKSLLTLLTGHTLLFNKIMIYGNAEKKDSGEIGEKGLLFLGQFKPSTKRELQSHDLLITYKDLQGEFQSVFSKWFELKEELHPIYNLVVSNFYHHPYLEVDFLNLMHSIEGFHRIRYGGEYVEQEEYEFYLKRINEIIDSEILNKDLKQRLKRMLIYGNEFSLRKRIKDLFSKMDEETIKILIGNNKKSNSFIDKIVNIRNDLTHPNKENVSNLIQIDELSRINHQLKCFAMILLLTTLGVPEKMIAQKLKENRFYNITLDE
jgi:hypothetical protein